MDLFSQLLAVPGLAPYLVYVTTAVTVAAAIATVLPAPGPTAPAAYKAVYGAINWVALNFGHAKNAPVPAPVSTVVLPSKPAAGSP